MMVLFLAKVFYYSMMYRVMGGNMGLDACFEIEAEKRVAFINDKIVVKLPNDIKERARETANKIVNNYVGRDMDALSILFYAAEQGRFDEFADRLEKHYKESFQFVHPEARRVADVPLARVAQGFFLRCYQDLGIRK